MRKLLATLLLALAGAAHADVGVTEIPVADADGPITVFYPSSTAATAVQRGLFRLRLAENGAPVKGNGRLIVLSHGSGGSPWTYTDLASRLAEAGFVVAAPLHRGDNWKDHSKVGPETWKLRPLEVSHTIDRVTQDPRFAALVAPERVGAYGMSAGGHTMLALAGGRWSPSALLKHCQAHLEEDFHTCVGLATRLRGDALDGVKKAVVRGVIRLKLLDAQWYSHHDPRIRAVVAEVPLSVDFDLNSLAQPQTALGIVQAGQDKWLLPRFHSNALLRACASCELVADLPGAGHGSLLSPQPLPEHLSELAHELLRDPPGFDRAQVGTTHERVVAYFRRHLLP